MPGGIGWRGSRQEPTQRTGAAKSCTQRHFRNCPSSRAITNSGGVRTHRRRRSLTARSLPCDCSTLEAHDSFSDAEVPHARRWDWHPHYRQDGIDLASMITSVIQSLGKANIDARGAYSSLEPRSRDLGVRIKL